jgi:hypothetical protein
MPSVIIASLMFIWVILTWWLIFHNKVKRRDRNAMLEKYLKFQQIKKEAKEAGWDITINEFLAMVVFSMVVGVILAIFFKNPLIIFAGILIGYYLPRFIIQKIRKNQRMSILITIPDFGRILIARLLDHPSIITAMEITQHDIQGYIKEAVINFIKDVGVGRGVEEALDIMSIKIGFRKFNTFVETLLIAHQEGYSKQALRALEKCIEGIENDVKAIETIELTTKKKRRDLTIGVLAAWAIPALLSFMNTDNSNVFLDTIPGKVLIFSYIIASVYALIKGDEYLSIKIEEL